MKVVHLGDIARATSERAGGENLLPVYSVTKHDGFVRSDEYFKKQVFSRDLSNYKLVRANHFAYATIHLDEGSIGIAPEDGLVSPMYTSFSTDSNAVLPDYLIRFLRSPRALAAYPSLGKGSAERRRSISFTRLSELRVPLPPLDEQRRIAAMLDKADELRTKRRQALAHLDALTRSIFHSMFGDPTTSAEWQREPLGKVTLKVGSGATPRGGKDSYKGTEIALIRSMNVRDEEFQPKDLALIDDIQADALKVVTVQTNDVLLNITGASVARVCRAPSAVIPARVNQHVCIIRPTQALTPEYLEGVLLAPAMKAKLLSVAGGGATREAITKQQILALEVPLPPLGLQHKFTTSVAAVERLKELHRKHLAELDTLFASLQHRAFKGEL